MRRRPPGDSGQATVEFALILPMIVMLLTIIVQFGLIVRDQLAVIHAAREGARAGSIDDTGRPTAAATDVAIHNSRLHASRLAVTANIGSAGLPGQVITVTVTYRSPIIVPFARRVLPERTVRASVSMMLEPTA